MGKGSKNLSKRNRKLALENQSTVLHYRMYKAGRMWLFAGIATFSFGAALISMPSQASAVTETVATAQPSQPAAGSQNIENAPTEGTDPSQSNGDTSTQGLKGTQSSDTSKLASDQEVNPQSKSTPAAKTDDQNVQDVAKVSVDATQGLASLKSSVADTQTQPNQNTASGEGTFKLDSNNTLTLTDQNGQTSTIDLSKLAPKVINLGTPDTSATGPATVSFVPGGDTSIQPNNIETGGGSYVVNTDGTIKFTDANGTVLTIDPKNLHQPTIVNIYGSTPNIPIYVPDQTGGVMIKKATDGDSSWTFTYPSLDGSTPTTQTNKIGESTKVDANGYTFTLNKVETITVLNGFNGLTYNFGLDVNKETDAQPGSKVSVAVLPGKDGITSDITVEQTSNGSIVLHVPDGTTVPVKPGEHGTLPNGSLYLVDKDGSITFITPDGENKASFNPSDGDLIEGPTKVTSVYAANQDGTGGSTVVVTQKSDGTISLTDNDKIQSVKIGDQGTVNGLPYIVNKDGSITVTKKDGSTQTINPNDGTPVGAKTTFVFIPYNTPAPSDNSKTDTPTPVDSHTDTPTPVDNNTPTPTPGDTPTTPDNGTAVPNTDTNDNGGNPTATTPTTGEGTATSQGGAVTGTNAGTAESGLATSNSPVAASANVHSVNQNNGSVVSKSTLPQTDENSAEGVATLGLLGGLVSLLGLAGVEKRRKND